MADRKCYSEGNPSSSTGGARDAHQQWDCSQEAVTPVARSVYRPREIPESFVRMTHYNVIRQRNTGKAHIADPEMTWQ